MIVPAATEEVGGIDVILPPYYEIFWSGVLLLILLYVVGKYAVPKITALLDERAEKIEAGLSAADRAQEDAQLAARERTKILGEADAEAHRARERANEEARSIVEEARKEAEATATRVQEQAKQQIAAEQAAARVELKKEVGILAADLAEKIIGEHLKDQELTTRVVDRYLDELDRETSISEVGA